MLSNFGTLGFTLIWVGLVSLFSILVGYIFRSESVNPVTLSVSVLFSVLGIALLVRDPYVKKLGWQFMRARNYLTRRGLLGFVLSGSGLLVLVGYIGDIYRYQGSMSWGPVLVFTVPLVIGSGLILSDKSAGRVISNVGGPAPR
jgi:hypothetical protein